MQFLMENIDFWQEIGDFFPSTLANAINNCFAIIMTRKSTIANDSLLRFWKLPHASATSKNHFFSGCGGNSNRFMRRAHCRNRCVKNPHKNSTSTSPNSNFLELKQHRRTLTTTSTTEVSSTRSEITSTTMEPWTQAFPVKKIEFLKSNLCTDCDPLFGTCNDGVCGCMKGFRSLGKVCIDLNECDNGAICGDNARCVNTVGSYTCECDSGFQVDGRCKIGPEACQDEFDVNLTEEDCNHGKQELRYYYDSVTASCKRFFYGGCKTTSRNFFADLQTCDVLCVSLQRDYLASAHHFKIDLLTSPASLAEPDKPLSVEDWPLRPVTVRAPLNLDFGPSYRLGGLEKMKEAQKAEKIVKEITPGLDICSTPLDPTLREECLSADWVERFFWNSEFSECEPFWYDNSCDPRDKAAKNFFENFDACKSTCSGNLKTSETSETYILPTDEATTSTPATTSVDVSKDQNPVITSTHPAQTSSSVEVVETSKDQDPEFVQVENWEGLVDERISQKSEKIEKVEIVHRGSEVCHVEFNQNLRNECKTGDWTEYFYWNLEIQDCEAFWYDKSCLLPKFAPNQNLFENFEKCQESCKKPAKKDDEKGPETTATVPLPYKQDDPLNIIFANAIKPEESSLLPDKLPGNHETNFGAKNIEDQNSEDQTSTTKFDRLKYMAEFRKRLLALPEDFKTTSATPSEAPKVSVTTSEAPATSETPATSSEAPVRPSEAPASTRFLGDLCDEPLHPKLEEDCKNDNWEIRWFFNTDRGACKSFWYGGCEVESRNFFTDHANCRHACAHKYQASEFQTKISIPPGDLTTSPPFHKDRLTTSIKLTYPHSEDLFPTHTNSYQISEDPDRRFPAPEPPKHLALVSEGTKSSSEPSFYSHIDKVILDLKTGEHTAFQKPEEFVRRVESSSNAFVKYSIDASEITQILGGEHRSINDACDDEYDPKWDEDCLGDEWVIRSYWNSTTNSCKSFWYGGCQTSSRNIWFDREACQMACRHKLGKIDESPLTPSDIAATLSSTTKKREISDSEIFKQDLDQQLANIKKSHENREDLKFSKIVDHPVTVAAECLEPFNYSLAEPCKNGGKFENRFYFDKDSRSCRMFWKSEGCLGGDAKMSNNFADLETCQWKCEGRHPQPAGKSCLEKFDLGYLEDCRHGEFTNRFYFDHDRKKCVAFHWGGCQSKSQNFFTDMGLCQDLCENPPRELTQSCLEPFDTKYEQTCGNDLHQQYYYFDQISGICKMFWFGNCKGENQNIYSTLEACQWICERKREERKPAMCADKFDPKYTESCGEGKWTEKWYFEQSTGECHEFWWDGCTSPSQNIFPDQKSCTSNCQHPGFEISSKLATQEESKFRCLEPVEIGSCQETYPAFYYDKIGKTCRPFAYSGCGGNYNRFLTLSQCEGLCYGFNSMNEAEFDCHLQLHIGYGKNDENCIAQAGFRFYYDRSYGKCSQMWYLGCGGNANNFYTYESCQRTCSLSNYPQLELERKPRASSEVCFESPGDKGNCARNASEIALSRWTYQSAKCVKFSYTGCGGNRNRFATEDLCTKTCGGLLKSNDPRICSFHPDTGPCNQLHYQWFYNQTRGTCDQFLYGGCDGNPNRFDSFEICQKACELTGKDPCMDKLDRGKWCSSMSNMYYYNKNSKKCKGFHYTGCGKSGNIFTSLEDCQRKCEGRYIRAALPEPAASSKKKSSKSKTPEGYSGIKPVPKSPMIRHINLNAQNQTYFKSEAQWMDYNICYGYRYNVSGPDTKLMVHLCVIGGRNECISESFGSTDGEEFCQVLRPFLRGPHLYSWYFGLDTQRPRFILNRPETGLWQPKNETMAAILLLKANNCHDIC
ncbi:unnamed protein product [Caenorhabditis angaria]|uniref:Uncharacterized protein n=1 Tax=Caenorhabditis angaria TaxID=860376 RepID=A0A9P1N427_9PELO|nr:unnamed protein product [Caenorhabditis angaria]